MSGVGVPIWRKMRASWSLSLVPVSKGLPVAISAKMHLKRESKTPPRKSEKVKGELEEGEDSRHAKGVCFSLRVRA